jgi:hypothetical protein
MRKGSYSMLLSGPLAAVWNNTLSGLTWKQPIKNAAAGKACYVWQFAKANGSEAAIARFNSINQQPFQGQRRR